MSVIQRDYSVRAATGGDPWNLPFFYSQSGTGAGQKFQVNGLALSDGTPINKQTAIGTAITYYHRGGNPGSSHWQEPPNFLNPYWRATLVAEDTDATGRATPSDAERLLLHVGEPSAAATLHQLMGIGFGGLH
jgi:hypothetical protein